MSFAIVNSELVHELQKERGLTAGYLGSNGDPVFRKKLLSQRKLTDEKNQNKRSANKNYQALVEQMGLSAIKQKNSQLLDQLQKLRRKVDQQDIALSKAIGYYTQLNGSLLSVISSVAKVAEDAELKQLGLAYYNFTQAKERAGIERAVMTGVFGVNEFSMKTFIRFTTLVNQQNTYLLAFENLASKPVIETFRQIQNSKTFKKIASFREIANRKNIEGGFGIEASTWFAAATDRINLLKDIEEAISTELDNVAVEHYESAENVKWFYILLTLILVVSCLWLAFAVIRGINKQVTSVVSTLEYCVEHNALDKALPIQGQDEISIMCMAVNELLTTFKTTIENLTASSEVLASSSEQNSVTVQQTSNALISQKEQTYQVASAIEEMTVTIEEVANNINATAGAAKDAENLSLSSQDVVNQSISQIQVVSEQVSEVHQLIATLNQSSSEITNVIGVIKSIADQTNLLALNAAIEAARAGEQGRGFAVVADEVRTLAQRTQDSTQQIDQIISSFTLSTNNAFNIIEDSQKSANLSVEQATKVANVIEEIQSSITTINEMTDQIATATEEQVVVAAEIGRNVAEISSAADESATAAEQIAETSQSQAKLAIELKEISTSFKL